MPASCSAPRCTNTSSDGYCLVCVPVGDDLRNVWINAAKNPEWTPSKHARLCEVHFDASALYCVGSKKCMKKDALPIHFCNCIDPEKPSSQHDVTEENCDHSYASKSISKLQCNPLDKSLFQKKQKKGGGVRKRWKNFSHSLGCVLRKFPVSLKTLREAAAAAKGPDKSQKENVLLGSKNNGNFSERMTQTENVSNSADKYVEICKKVRLVEETNRELQKKVKHLEERVQKSTVILNKVLNKDQQEAVWSGTTKGFKWSDETLEKAMQLHLACGATGYKQLIQLVAPFPAIRTLQLRTKNPAQTKKQKQIDEKD